MIFAPFEALSNDAKIIKFDRLGLRYARTLVASQVWFQCMCVWWFFEKKRDYFGPVNIEKLHIKILNKFGELADNVNTNYSLTFQFETLYSSIRN